ncbi:MAG: hypothetical protein NVSMB64_29570 [Candidatus Velthaea sp.]
MNLETFDVIAEEAPEKIVEIGSVRAASVGLAIDAARDIYFRRSSCLRLGVRRGDTTYWSAAPEAALTARNQGRTYRTPAYFVKARYPRDTNG